MKKIYLYIFVGLMWCNIGFGDEVTLARTEAVKSNYRSAIKYMAAENMKCNLGVKTSMDGNLICSGRTAHSVVYATDIVLADSFINPYTGYNAIIISKRNITDRDVGFVFISASGSNVIFKTCFKEPCNQENNQLSNTVQIK